MTHDAIDKMNHTALVRELKKLGLRRVPDKNGDLRPIQGQGSGGMNDEVLRVALIHIIGDESFKNEVAEKQKTVDANMKYPRRKKN